MAAVALPAPFRPRWPRCSGCGGPAAPAGEPHFSVVVAVQTLSEPNRRDRWGRRSRVKAQRNAAFEAVSVALGAGAILPPRGPWLVRFTRASSSRLDPGNLAASLKAVEDQLAACLGVDDGSPLYEPVYEQTPRGRGPEAVWVDVWGTDSPAPVPP